MADMTDQVFAGRVLELAQSVVTQHTTNVEKTETDGGARTGPDAQAGADQHGRIPAKRMCSRR